MSRGNNKSEIFLDDSDRRFYLGLLRDKFAEFKCIVYAYSLMPNHVHIFLRTESGNISDCMFRINLGYSKYFNDKYGRSGHLFGARFKSRLVQENRYFLSLLRYIHLNPVKAGLSARAEDYPWSSHLAYLGKGDRLVTDTSAAMSMLGQEPGSARLRYMELMGKKMTDDEWRVLNRARNGILGDSDFRKKKGSCYLS
ncbi:MAG: transposase [Elusimicrobiota bacterium]